MPPDTPLKLSAAAFSSLASIRWAAMANARTRRIAAGLAVLWISCARNPTFLHDGYTIPPRHGLLLEASVFKGVAEESWALTVMPTGRVSLEISYFDSLHAWGNLLGSFMLDPTDLEKIRLVVEGQRFMDLPEKILPSVLYEHPPQLRLEVSMDGKTHRVDVRDPEEIGTSPELERFLAVWNTVFERIPTKPTW